ncbi:dihydrofolate reductase [Candidatus Woesearchaeota archaeon]|nr:dihydrofolate reductase [Candidatus Woesearchaeota archaeon]
MDLVLIAAVAENNVIGYQRKMPWHIPVDLQHFKELTTPYPVIMGRETFESIPEMFRPLPNRPNIVLTNNSAYYSDNIHVAHSIENALEQAEILNNKKAYVIGGEKVFKETLPLAQTLEITEVHREYNGDTFFPEINPKMWVETQRTTHSTVDQQPSFSFVSYGRVI